MRENEFQARARRLAELWREERRLPIGEHRGHPMGSRLEMPFAREELANYLTDTVKRVVREQVLDPRLSRGKVYQKPRIFDNLLSSQPMAFNLFGELSANYVLATEVFRDVLPDRVDRVTGFEFEHSPGRMDRRYTENKSAFDVYVRFSTPGGGKGFAGIEVKYHEDLKNRPSEHKPRYDEVARKMNVFHERKLGDLRERPVQQIWLDHLLSGIHGIEDRLESVFLFLYPKDNACCAAAIEKYRECLMDERGFVPLTLERFVEALKRHSEDGWIRDFEERYLDFGRIDGG